MHEKQTPIPHNAGEGIQSCVRVLSFISWEVSLSKEIQKQSQDHLELRSWIQLYIQYKEL